MAGNEKELTDLVLSDIRDSRSKNYERAFVDGWKIEEWSSLGEYIREGFNRDTFTHESFESTEELVLFIKGVFKYSDRNSFFYDGQDEAEFEQEGHFQSVQCPTCLEELRYQLEQESIPQDKINNPEITPAKIEYPEPSFKQGADKNTRIIQYQCADHPEVSIREKESWYEENL